MSVFADAAIVSLHYALDVNSTVPYRKDRRTLFRRIDGLSKTSNANAHQTCRYGIGLHFVRKADPYSAIHADAKRQSARQTRLIAKRGGCVVQ